MSLQDELKQLETKLEQNSDDCAALHVGRSKLLEEKASITKHIADAEVTYSIGDRFKDFAGKKWMICIRCGGNNGVSLVNLNSGALYYGYSEVVNTKRITRDELVSFSDKRITRYWDNRKQQKGSE